MPTKYPVYQCRTCDHVWEPGRPEVKFCKHCGGSDIFRPAADTPPRQGRKTTVTVKYSSSTPVHVSAAGPAESAAVAKVRSGMPAFAWFFIAALLLGAAATYLGFPALQNLMQGRASAPEGAAVNEELGRGAPRASATTPGVVPAAAEDDGMVDVSLGDLIGAWQRGADELRHRFGRRRLRIVTQVWMSPGQATMFLSTSPPVACHLPQPWVMRRPPDPSQTLRVSGRLRGIEGRVLALSDCRIEP